MNKDILSYLIEGEKEEGKANSETGQLPQIEKLKLFTPIAKIALKNLKAVIAALTDTQKDDLIAALALHQIADTQPEDYSKVLKVAAATEVTKIIKKVKEQQEKEQQEKEKIEEAKTTATKTVKEKKVFY
jgi:hypothetical protein